MRIIVIIDMGKPILMKSLTFKYGCWKSSTNNSELTFGNDENGKAIAADIANADPIVVDTGMLIETPICAITGIKIIDATVCDTNVAIIPQNERIDNNANHGLCNGKSSIIPLTIYSNKPDESTALPSTLPPPTRNNVCHGKLLKSTSVSIPVPNINATYPNDIIEISPKIEFVIDDVANISTAIPDNKIIILDFFVETLSESLTTKGIEGTSEGSIICIIKTQLATVHTKQKGSAINNHLPNEIKMPSFAR